MTGSEKTIAVAGNLLVDHIREIDELPVRSELARIHRILNSAGGCVCNTGVDLKKLDPSLTVRAYGVVGEDSDGDFICNYLSACGVRTEELVRRGQSAFTDVFAETQHHCRTFYTFGGACDTFDLEDIRFETLQCDLFHIGYLLLLKALDSPDTEYGTRMARLLSTVQKKGIPTSIDVVSENSDRFPKIVIPALKYTDYLTVNELEAGNTVGFALRDPDTGKLLPNLIGEALRILRRFGVRKWVIIHAPEAAFGMDESGTLKAELSNPLPKGYIGGTTGAGDAFCAGVLLAAVRGVGISEALVYGNAAAQVSLRSDTATGSIIPIEQAIEHYNETEKDKP